MALFDIPIARYMSAPRVRVSPDTHLPEVARLLELHAVSALPVVDDAQQLRGIITRTDLLHQGAVLQVSGGPGGTLAPPDRRVADVAHAQPRSVSVNATVQEGVEIMREERIHRVCVLDGSSLVGILSAWDVMRVVADAGAQTPISQLMTSDPSCVSPSTPTTEAVAKLQNSHVHALLVVDKDWPQGVFGQREALLSDQAAQRGCVEDWFDPRVLSLPPSMSAAHAARQALTTATRWIAVIKPEGIEGIVTPWDFTRRELSA